MAEVSGLFNAISGRVGNVVFVRRGGKTFVKKIPGKRKSPYSENELKQHSRFGFACKISGKICKIEELKYFWHKAKARNQSSQNRVFKENYHLLDAKNLTGIVKLVPDYGFNLNEPIILAGKSGLSIESKPLKSGSSEYFKGGKDIIAAGIIILKNPKSKNREEYDIMSFKSEKNKFSPKSLISLKIPFEGDELKKYKSYLVKEVFVVLITLEEDGTPLRNSEMIISRP